MKRVLLLFAAIIAGHVARAQELEFFREDLSFTLQEDQFIVDGLYCFRNNSREEIRKMLFYPFPDTEYYGEISFLSIHVAGDTVSMVSRVTDHGSLFKLILPPGEEAMYRITYHQQLVPHEARYILTSTQEWGNPLEEANYTLLVPKELSVASFSIDPDATEEGPGHYKFVWSRKDFMPQIDFIFTFVKR